MSQAHLPIWVILGDIVVNLNPVELKTILFDAAELSTEKTDMDKHVE